MSFPNITLDALVDQVGDAGAKPFRLVPFAFTGKTYAPGGFTGVLAKLTAKLGASVKIAGLISGDCGGYRVSYAANSTPGSEGVKVWRSVTGGTGGGRVEAEAPATAATVGVVFHVIAICY